jgi:putative transposase
VVRGRRVRTTVPGPRSERAGDRVNRDFTADSPNRTWCADFTYVAAWCGIVYVAFVVDVYSRAIVGWSAALNKRTPLVLNALDMAPWRRDRAGHTVDLRSTTSSPTVYPSRSRWTLNRIASRAHRAQPSVRPITAL